MSWPRALRRPAAWMVTVLARPASRLIPRLRSTAAVRPLSESFYTVTVPDLEGTPVSLSRFAGHATLVVNVASECGFTPQYAALQALHVAYAARGFSVLGFPSHEFGRQEPGSAEDIRRFCEREYQVTFPLFAKTETRPGPGQSPAYRRLGECGHLPQWNFYKFLVGRDGQVAAVFPMTVSPASRELRRAIERALEAGDPSAGSGAT